MLSLENLSPPPPQSSMVHGGGGKGSDGSTVFWARLDAHTTQVVLIQLVSAGLFAAALLGTQSVLEMYLLAEGLSEGHVTALVNAFIGIYAVFSVLGGRLGDRFGAYKILLVGGSLWVAGAVWAAFFTLAFVRSLNQVILGLGVVAVGYGVVAPVQVTFLAKQFKGHPDEEVLTEASMSIFYSVLQCGNILGNTGNPVIRERLGGTLALWIVAFAALLGLAVILAGTPMFRRRTGDHLRVEKMAAQHQIDWHRLVLISLCLIGVPMFYAVLNLQSTSFVLQANHLRRRVFGLEFPPDVMPATEDVMLIPTIWMLDHVVYSRWGPGAHTTRGHLIRMTAGYLFAVLALLFAGCLQYYIYQKPPGTLNVLWQLPSYLALAGAESLITVTALNFCLGEAAPGDQSLAMAVLFLLQGVGAVIGASVALAPFLEKPRHSFMFWASLMMGTIGFVLLASQYYLAAPKRTHLLTPLADAPEKPEEKRPLLDVVIPTG